MDCKKIGKYIKDKRKSLGYKQSDLGEMLSVSDKAVSKWECGVALPDVALLPELSKILNVNISEILNGEDDPKVEEEIKNKNKSKICLISLSILSSILFILVVILGIYFINNYDKVHVYKLVGEKDGFRVEGKLISIGDESYFILSQLGYLDKRKKDFEFLEINYNFYYKDKLLYTNRDDKICTNITNYFEIKKINFKSDEKFNFAYDDFFVLKINFIDIDKMYSELSIGLKIYE